MKKINNYFFDADEITEHDALWFYGFYGLALIIGVFAVVGLFKGVN